MAVTKNETQVKWDTTANSKSVTAGSSATSEVVSIDATAVDASVMLKADNNGTPASGDTITMIVQGSLGDPDADADVTDEYESDNHASIRVNLDTFQDDPGIKIVAIPTTWKEYQIKADSNAASNGITVSAQHRETRVS